MAPKKSGTKREAVAKVTAAPKRAKVDPAVEGVTEAIESAESLPEGCRKMLLASLQHALGTPVDQRHEVQHKIVAMIGEVVQGVESHLQTAVDEESFKLTEDERTGAELRLSVASAEESQSVVEKEVDGKVEVLKQASEAASSAKAMVQEKVEAQRTGDEAMATAVERKRGLERGVQEHLKAILEGTSENPMDHHMKLLPLLQDLRLDDSLMNALPNVCTKQPAERGAFDTMVLEQLSQSLQEHITSLGKIVEECKPAAEARAAAVASAQAAAEEAAAVQAAADQACADARARAAVAAAQTQSTRQALTSYEADFAKKAAVRDTCAQKLEDFKAFNVGSFELLRDKVAAALVAGA